MKAISLHQPWATFIAFGWKTIETRDHDRFRSLAGTRIAIHGAKTVEKEAFGSMHLPMEPFSLQWENLVRFAISHRGVILCTARIVAAKWAPRGNFDGREEWNRRAMCDVAGRFCLFLEDVRPARIRIPFRGRQGIFCVPDGIVEGISGKRSA
ncbi:MAG: hypothetical protein DRH56_09415 [Deltaproteobacteria bacterium]|nr:MAG: hypothetical protein DRH56_09415 [Deltaproteobacteria bacterium]